MLRRILISTYLLLYALSIMWALAVVLVRADRSGYFNKSVLALGVLTGALLLLSGLGSLFGRRWFRSSVSVVMIAWSAFLSWFSWFSDGSPFIQHEVHSFDPSQLAAESRHFTTEPSRFTGKERDCESGNEYFGARYPIFYDGALVES